MRTLWARCTAANPPRIVSCCESQIVSCCEQPQVDLLRGKYEEVRGKLDCFQLLQEELGAGFTANQVRLGGGSRRGMKCVMKCRVTMFWWWIAVHGSGEGGQPAAGRLTPHSVDQQRSWTHIRLRPPLVAPTLSCTHTRLHPHSSASSQIKRQLTKLGIVSGRAKEKGLTAEQVGRWWCLVWSSLL